MTFLRSPNPKFLPIPLRMIKTGGNLTGVGLSYNLVSPMAADANTDPMFVISNKIVIPLSWKVYSGIVYAQVKWSGGTMPKVGCMIKRNGVEVARGTIQTSSSNFATAELNTIITPGDSFEMFWQGEGNFFIRPSCLPGEQTYLSVSPI